MEEEIKIGLSVIGLQDQHLLKCALMNCDDPLKAITEFQEENSILLPTLKPSIPLLDLHGIKRLDFHQSVADKLRDRLTCLIEELYNSKAPDCVEKLEDLLTRSFPVINVPRMTPLVMTIMKHLPNIDHRYLEYLMNRNEYYSICPIEVKRQIWLLNIDLFFKELDPIFDKCLQHFEDQLVNLEFIQKSNVVNEDKDQANLLKLKRHSNHINEIVRMIGQYGKLYNQTVSHLTKLFLSTKNWFYASVRSLLLIKLTDSDESTQADIIYKFTWTLNTCLKERKIDGKRVKELEAVIDAKKFDKIFLDAAFILADYFAIDTCAYSAINLLSKCVLNDTLPRKCDELLCILRLLKYSLASLNILENSVSSKEIKLDSDLVTGFLPNLAYLMVDHQECLYEDTLDQLNSLSSEPNTPNVFTSSDAPLAQQPAKMPNFTLSTEKSQVLETLAQFIEENDVCRVLALYFALECMDTSDWINLKHILQLIKYPNNNEGFEKWFVSQFITSASHNLDNFRHDWYFSIIFDDFLVKHLKSDSSLELVFKYIDKIFTFIQHATLFRILEELKPRKQCNSSTQQSYSKLRIRFDNMLQASNKL